MSEKKDVSKILYNYNLLDDYFIDQDVSTNVGEIFVQQPDANVSISPNDKEMYFQMKKLTTAVDKIWKGYLSAYDKTTYKRQFDLYPLRDFDEYMASLGAKRSSDKKDFESVGPITDWLALVKKEKDIRTSDFKKADEERQKQEKEQQILDKEKQIEEAKKKNEQSSKKEQINTSPQKDATNVSTNTQINTNPDLTRFGVEEEKLNKENYSKIKEKLNEQNKALEENQSSDAGLTVERIKQRDETAKLLQESTKFFEGKIIEEKKQKTITSAMNPYELKISKGFDGFHTQGPFCLEKRKYFIEIFRPSISHWETEFREAEHDPQNVKDAGNDILKNTHSFVKSPLEDVNQIDPSTLMGIDPNTGQFRLNPDGSPQFPVIMNQKELDALSNNNPLEKYKQDLADALRSFVSAYVHKFDTGNGTVSAQALSILKERMLVKLQGGVYLVPLEPNQNQETRSALKIAWYNFVDFTMNQSDWTMALFVRLADVINKDDVAGTFKRILDSAPGPFQSWKDKVHTTANSLTYNTGLH